MVAVDAMGGDFAPGVVIKGALKAAQNGIPVQLFGPATLIEKELSMLDSNWKSLQLKLADSSSIIGMGDEPVDAVRKKRDSSLVKAVESVKAGTCNAVVSAGNSGALMVAATFTLGRNEGVERPAIAGWLPSKKGMVLALDLGANTDCKPSYLLQFAFLGHEYSQKVLKIENPRIGLLSNGSEEGKGSLLTKEAFELLMKAPINFVGNIEPIDILENKVDVVLSDGFSGNILLKTMEAMHKFLSSIFKESLTRVIQTYAQDEVRLSLAQEFSKVVFQDLARQAARADQGGAVLLGVNGTVIVAHGSAQESEIEKAITLAYNVSKAGK